MESKVSRLQGLRLLPLPFQYSIDRFASSGRRRSRTSRKPSAPSTRRPRRPRHLAAKVLPVSYPTPSKPPSDLATIATLSESTPNISALRRSAPPSPLLVLSKGTQRKRRARYRGMLNPGYQTLPRPLPLPSITAHPSMARPRIQAQHGTVAPSPTTEASSPLLQTKTHPSVPHPSNFPILHYHQTKSLLLGTIALGDTVTRIPT